MQFIADRVGPRNVLWLAGLMGGGPIARYFNTPIITPIVDEVGKYGLTLLHAVLGGARSTLGFSACVAAGYAGGLAIWKSDALTLHLVGRGYSDTDTTEFKKLAAFTALGLGVMAGNVMCCSGVLNSAINHVLITAAGVGVGRAIRLAKDDLEGFSTVGSLAPLVAGLSGAAAGYFLCW